MATHNEIIKVNQEVSRLQRKVYRAVVKQDSNLASLVTELKQKIDELAYMQITE